MPAAPKEARTARGIAESARGKEAVDAEWHPDGWMRAWARCRIRKAQADGDGAPRGAAGGA